jgi:ATP-dependent DNA helicase RecG
VESVDLRRPRRGLIIVEARVADPSGSLTAVWFNQAFREHQLQVGSEVALSGKLERFGRKLQMKSPAADLLSSDSEGLTTGRVVPIHPSVGGIKPGNLRRAIHNAVTRSRPLTDPVPERIREELSLVGRDQALSDIHFPESLDQAAAARHRLVFDELFRLELALALQKRRQMQESRGVAHVIDGELVKRFVSGLPFALTGAQLKVLDEIRADLKAAHPMHRLLQGEVGSGKTAVAVAALLIGVQGGMQGAIMAPTEVLADQHFLAVSRLLEVAGIAGGGSDRLGMESLFASPAPEVKMALLTSSQALTNFATDLARAEIVDQIASGSIDLVVGTHALIQEGLHFARLGIAVVDEQHRFGVAQRVLLKEKGVGIDPDLLIMTATPIPRTIAMTLYGDLDVSIIDQMPPGRSPTKTLALSASRQESAWDIVRAEVSQGRQAFVVCPLVEESPKVEAASATTEFERLGSVFSTLRVGLIHGQLPHREKESVMTAFRNGEVDVLVATTVIEVGIDVPNATVMVIEDADRFGLSQLHQLRGRVGRGQHPGTCVLLADPTTEEGEARIEAMTSTNDGFLLAEEDLRIRGQGTVFGTRQSGMADLKLADVLADFDVLLAARLHAFALVEADENLSDHSALKEEIRTLLGERVEWLFIS